MAAVSGGGYRGLGPTDELMRQVGSECHVNVSGCQAESLSQHRAGRAKRPLMRAFP